MMRKIWIGGTVISVMGLGWWGGRQWVVMKTQQQPIEMVRVGVVGDTSLLMLLAQDQGLFKDQGLEVTLVRYTVGSQGLEDVLKGNVDVAVGADYVGVRNSFDGQDYKILASIAKTKAYEVVARKDDGIEQPADMRGKRMGVSRGTAGDFWLSVFLRSNQLTEEDVEVVNLKPVEIADKLVTGEIGGGLNLEPYTYEVKRVLEGQTVSWFGGRGQGIYSLVYGSSEWVEAHPEAVKRLVLALVRAERYLEEHPSESYQLLAGYFDYDEDYMNAVVRTKYTFEVNLVEALVLSMEDEARWMIENGLAERTQVPNYLDWIDFEAMDAVKPEAVTVIH